MQRICGNHPKKPRWRCSRTVSTETCFISQSKKSGRVETSRRVEPWTLTTLQRSLWQIDETRRVLFKQTRWGSHVVWAVDNSEIVREGTINNSEHATKALMMGRKMHWSVIFRSSKIAHLQEVRRQYHCFQMPFWSFDDPFMWCTGLAHEDSI